MKTTVTDKSELINIFKDTLTKSRTCYKLFTRDALDQTIIYQGDLQSKPNCETFTDIEFYEGGTLEISTKFARDYDTTILNFASGRKPGGWPEQGCLTQEENLCRCTNLYSVINTSKCFEGYYKPNQKVGEIGTSNVIYSPNIVVFKDDSTYDLVPEKYVDVITCPAPSLLLSPQSAYPIYLKRIEQIVLSAIENDTECIVLGAWGCGAFRQDARLIASAFVEILNKYSGYFKKVVFAIKSTPTWTNKNATYPIFLDMCKKSYKGNVLEVK